MNTYALLDEGSTITLIDQKFARDLGIKGQKLRLSLKGINDEVAVTSEINVTVSGDGDTYNLSGAVTVKNLKLPSQSVPEKLVENLAAEKVNVRPYKNADVKILIGQDNWRLIATREIVELKLPSFALSRTLLGWVLHGHARANPRSIQTTLSASGLQRDVLMTAPGHDEPHVEELRLDDLIKEYFQLDSMGVCSERARENEHDRAQSILNATCKRAGKRWEIGLLWKEDRAPTTDGYATARKRLATLERKLDRDPAYARLYYKEMQRFLDNGYAVKVDKHAKRSRYWYLPHFGVTNVNKPDKIRIVLDAAAKTDGLSLNDQLDSGPDQLKPLPGVIIRFRQYVVAVNADISDMFLRVGVMEEDRGAQRFLWRGKDRDREPDVIEMTCLIFGATSSPCEALYVKNENARRYRSTKPVASKSIEEDSYMDNYLTSKKSISEAKELVRDVIKINSEANFEMHGWTSNEPSILPGNAAVANSEMRLCDRGQERVLGLYWDVHSDVLRFNAGLSKIPADLVNGRRKPTKREFLRVIMSVFDPLGILAPYTLKSKLIMQEIWRSGVNWDEPLRDEEFAAWLSWISKIKYLKECSIPRCYMPAAMQDEKAQLHVFCDASLAAYAAVAYLRFQTGNEPAHVSLIMAKSRVAPLKLVSVPRLELQAALLGARLAKFIEGELEIEISKRWFWSDSTTVLHWIRSEPRARQVFVAKRLGEISDITRSSEWRWVPTKQNPADDATRFSNDALCPNTRWFNGPEFLKNPETDWPVSKVLDSKEKEFAENLELRKAFVNTIVATTSDFPLPIRLMGWHGLLIIARRIRNVCSIWRKRERPEISVANIQRDEEYWFRVIQSDCFETEINRIKNNKEISKGSKIASLRPFIDEKGILRAKGRVTKGPTEDFNNQPIILESKHFATKSLIATYHRRLYHASNETVLNEIRQKFFVIGLREALRSIVSKCIVCRINRRKPQNPLMAALPAGRVAYRERPFTHCGVDYFGPMNVKIGRRREKRWGILFTCLTTRAVHLELAHSLSSDSAIMALQRLAARRGAPAVMYSDNGTNFRGASKELLEAVAEIDKTKIKDYALRKRIKWIFNPPDAPHMGGAWERLVRSVKIALNVVLREQAPSEEVLYTLLTEIEHSINSRPLTHVSLDPRDKEALTPNHFLIGTSSGELDLGAYEARNSCPRKQWRIAQSFADAFWRRWIREYLPTLIPRSKWTKSEPPLEEGDIVLIVDLQAPRNYWKRGTVIRVFEDQEDEQVRIAEVHTSTGDYLRPTRKLIKLLGANEVQN